MERIGKIKFLQSPTTQMHRPAFPGISIGHFKTTAGTFGCLVEDDTGIYILSNNHVLANSNAGSIGDPILQPGPADGGTVSNHQIAELADFVPIDFKGINYIDAAIAEPLDYSQVLPDIPYIGRIQGTTAPRIGKLVTKFGRTTGFTIGKITATNVDIKVTVNEQPVWFLDQIEIRAPRGKFSAGGDSGSLILMYPTNEAIALLFAGTDNGVTFGNPINEILTALGVDIL